jgi:hypothetical protein
MSRIVVIAGLAALAVPSLAAAQTLGTFQWRLAQSYPTPHRRR